MYPLRIVAVTLMSAAVVAVLLLPVAAGPFTATNGPATAFRAATAVLVLLFSITAIVWFSFLLATGYARSVVTIYASPLVYAEHSSCLRR